MAIDLKISKLKIFQSKGEKTMLYFIVLTRLCNLNCIYCGNNPEPEIEPLEIQYKIDDLKKFIEADPDPTIAFYGGEPLLRIPIMEQIMDNIKAKRWILQTNGYFLHLIKPKYLRKFDAILVSIDGRKEVNDFYRGKGNYDVVLRNVKIIKENGFNGDLIARMAVSEKTDIYLDVKHLLNLDDPKFDHVHWQLDVMWDSPPYSRYNNFDKWARDSYMPGIRKLIDYWLETMEKRYEVLGIVPFLGIMSRLLGLNKQKHLPCGAGINAFTISTSGKILACPIAPEFDWNILGDIWSTSFQSLPFKVMVGEPCLSCRYYNICGGRCLFANKTTLWGLDGFRKVCNITRYLIDELKKIEPNIRELIQGEKIPLRDLNYPTYNNTTEIIP